MIQRTPDAPVSGGTSTAFQQLRDIGLVFFGGCLLTVGTIAAESPPAKAEPPIPDSAPVNTPSAVLKDPVIDPPALIPDVPVLPTGKSVPKRTGAVSPLWAFPPVREQDEFLPLTEPDIPQDGLTDAYFNDRLFTDSLAQGDPVGRAALVQAMTGAESMIDGLGGIPTPLTTAFPSVEVPATARIFKIGPLTLHPALNLGATFEQTERNTTQDVDQSETFMPTAGVRINALLGEEATGHTLSLNYGVQYNYNDGDSGANGSGNAQPIDQQLSMLGRMDFTKLRLGLGISFSSLSGTNRDFGGEVERQLLAVSLTSSYVLTPKTSFNWDLAVPVRQVSGGIDSSTLTSTMSLSHLYSPKLDLGVGITAGIEEVSETETQASNPQVFGSERSSTQAFEQISARVTFKPSHRLSVLGTFGAEYRNAGDTQTVTPLFSMSARWIVRAGTLIRLTAVRNVQSSGTISNANYVSTSGIVGVSQRLGNRITLDVSVGLERAVYDSIEAGDTISRTDQLYTGQVGFHYSLGRKWSTSLAYVYSKNNSSGDGFESSRWQLQVSYQF